MSDGANVIPFERPTARAAELLGSARRAQLAWCAVPVSRRVRILRRFRDRLAADALAFATCIGRRPAADTLTGEILPVLEACRFLERRAPGLLRTSGGYRRAGLWLAGTRSKTLREPYGVVLIIAPSNYPLMLPAIQTLQALAAGNAVIVQAAPGAAAAPQRMARLLRESGLPDSLVTVIADLDISHALIGMPIDKLFFTGSGETGDQVLKLASEHRIPATMELSGWDPMIVLRDADLDHVAAAVAFALTFNDGQTCVAPRRVLVPDDLHDALAERIADFLDAAAPVPFAASDRQATRALTENALLAGARLICGRIDAAACEGPVLLSNVPADSRLFHSEIFGPIAMLTRVVSVDDALTKANATDYALGASVFGDERLAESVAEKLDAGLITINDVIVPGAHPAVPLAARRGSGFGVTRGPEGLLEMTRPKAITTTRFKRPVVLRATSRVSAGTVATYIGAAHRRGALAKMRAIFTGRRGAERIDNSGRPE